MNLWLRKLGWSVVLLIPVACTTPGEDVAGDETTVTDDLEDGTDTTDDDGETTTDETQAEPVGVAAADAEPGSSFEDAPLVAFAEDNRMIFMNAIEQSGDLHVYDLGSFSFDDRIDVLGISAAGSSLDPVVALFDENFNRLFWEDDINPQSTNFDVTFRGNFRHDTDAAYLVVGASQFGGEDGEGQTGAYQVTVRVQRNVHVPILACQDVVLHWDAAEDVTVGGLEFGPVDAFDSATIDPLAFTDQTEIMKAAILEAVQEDFAAYNVTISTTDDALPGGKFSSVFFAEVSDQNLFGFAEVDFYNGSDQDDVVIFLEAFRGVSTTVQGTSQAVANVISREIGRSLGLMPTTNIADIMGFTAVPGDASATTLLDDRGFGISNLLQISIGLQDSDLLLSETVGTVDGGDLEVICGDEDEE